MTTASTARVDLTLGRWGVQFDERDARLQLTHGDGGVCVSGTLQFLAGEQAWRVVAPRDAVGGRLALEDGAGDIQGYVSFTDNGDSLDLLAHHRTAQNYGGILCFDGEVTFTPESFACRTQPTKQGRVIQLAAGPSDSRLNDSLFDPQRDCVFVVRTACTRFTTRGGGRYALTMRGRIEEPAEAGWSFRVEREYYRHRYVPCYRPIDRKRCPSPPTGWMSWNTYFDQATAEDNLAEARVGREQLQPFGLEFWSIESWQDNSDRLPVSGFDNLSLTPHPRQFPLGMKQLADDIRALGFRPGLWTAPFGTGSEAFYEEHKTWFLHDADGRPLATWNGTYTLDPSQDEVIDYLREIHRVASREWGYEFFKIDGMSGRHGGYCAHFYERPEVRAAFRDPACPNPFERCVHAFREGIGEDRVFLACQGHVTGAEAGVADAARLGADIVHPDQPPRWANLLNQATCTLNQVFAHNLVFFADPDTLLVGDALETAQARLATTVVALPGQVMFAGDKLRELDPSRIRLLQQVLPVCDVRPLDLYPVFRLLPVWDLKVARPFASWDVVALFNWGDAPSSLGFDFAELGLPGDVEHVLYEFWTQTYQGVHEGRFAMDVPGRAVRLLAVHRAQPHPQFLSSDRHVTQGAVELQNLAWNEAAKQLDGAVRLVGRFPLTLRFRVPAGYELETVSAAPDVACVAVSECADVVAVTLTGAVSQAVPFTLSWR